MSLFKKRFEYLKFNVELIKELEKAYNSSKAFSELDKYKDKSLLCLAVIERITSAVNYLNYNIKYPLKDEELITFMVYACIIKDGVFALYEQVFHKKAYSSDSNYFKHAQNEEFMNLNENDYISDDRFFEYFRSIIFAHPFNTNRNFYELFGSQISPRIYSGYYYEPLKDETPDFIGADVFTNKDNYEKTVLVGMSYGKLVEYVISKYNMLEKIIEWFKAEKLEIDTRWKKQKVDRSLDPVNAIAQINNYLVERFMPNPGIYQLWFYLTCDYNECNSKFVNLYRTAIISKISLIQDAVDNLDDSMIKKIVRELTLIPRNIKDINYYRIQKIYSYLPESDTIRIFKNSNESWALKQAEELSNDFAKRWVKIDVNNMSYSEIKLLVATACYMENHKKEFSSLL